MEPKLGAEGDDALVVGAVHPGLEVLALVELDLDAALGAEVLDLEDLLAVLDAVGEDDEVHGAAAGAEDLAHRLAAVDQLALGGDGGGAGLALRPGPSLAVRTPSAALPGPSLAVRTPAAVFPVLALEARARRAVLAAFLAAALPGLAEAGTGRAVLAAFFVAGFPGLAEAGAGRPGRSPAIGALPGLAAEGAAEALAAAGGAEGAALLAALLGAALGAGLPGLAPRPGRSLAVRTLAALFPGLLEAGAGRMVVAAALLPGLPEAGAGRAVGGGAEFGALPGFAEIGHGGKGARGARPE